MGANAWIELETAPSSNSQSTVAGFARTVPLPWLMLFALPNAEQRDSGDILLRDERTSCLDRFSRRVRGLDQHLSFIPNHRDELQVFANYFRQFDHKFLSVRTWELSAQWGPDECNVFNSALRSSLEALARDGSDLSVEQFRKILDWSHPERLGTNGKVEPKCRLFGGAVIGVPPAPWWPTLK